MSDTDTLLAEIKADLKHVVKLVEKHDKSLYGEDGGNGLVSHVSRHNEMETRANRYAAIAVGLMLTNIGTLIKMVWSYITEGNSK